MSTKVKFVQGNEACVEAALYAGLDFFAGYPITQSSEIAEMLYVCCCKGKRERYSNMERALDDKTVSITYMPPSNALFCSLPNPFLFGYAYTYKDRFVRVGWGDVGVTTCRVIETK